MPEHRDLAIVGAGPVGMALALAARRHGLDAIVLDARAADAWRDDPRALALSAGSRQLLMHLGAWPEQTTVITEVHVSQAGFGRTLFCAREQRLAALGHVVGYGKVCGALAGACREAGIELRHRCRVDAVRSGSDAVEIDTPDGTLSAGLLVHAEGAGDAGVTLLDYRQDAILCEVEPRHPHHGRAWERFAAEGPLALLPLGAKYSVVYVTPRERADASLALDDTAFAAALERRLGGRLHLANPTPRQRVPLALRVRLKIASEREVWIGNAAQTLHPISGQGLNLGLRDAWELAATLDREPDPRRAVSAYARRRVADRLAGIAFTDGIVRVFSNALVPLGLARGLGLAALDALPPLRRLLASRMIFGTRI